MLLFARCKQRGSSHALLKWGNDVITISQRLTESINDQKRSACADVTIISVYGPVSARATARERINGSEHRSGLLFVDGINEHATEKAVLGELREAVLRIRPTEVGPTAVDGRGAVCEQTRALVAR